MGSNKIGGKIVLDGEKEYRQALKNIKTEQAELRSEMKLCETAFKGSQNSLDALTQKHEILSKQIEAQAKKVDVNKQAVEDWSKKQEEAGQKVERYQETLKLAEKNLHLIEDRFGSSSDQAKEQAKVIDEISQKLGLAREDYDKASNKVSSYQSAVNYASAELKGMESELAKTEKYIGEASSSTDKCATSIDGYGQEVQEATQETSVFGDVLKANLASEAIMKGIGMLTEGVKKIAVSATEMGSSFESSMSQVAATMGMTADEIASGSREYTLLSDAAKECGKSTMFSATEAGEALNYLALAGYDAQRAAETLPKVLDLAAAGGLDLAYASDLVTDSMSALGMEAGELDNYIDEMARTSQRSNTSVSQLGEATLVCAGTVSLTGQSIETMNTELGILANNSLKGAEGGTHLRNILLSLSAPTDTAAIAIGQLGINVSDSKGNMRDLNDILTDMNAAMEGMSSTEKTRMISRIFNKTDIGAVNALLKGTGEEFDNLNKEINNCSGAAKDMAETLNNNLKGKVTILKSALEGLGISAYEIFDDTMKESVDSATEAIGKLQRSIDSGDLGVSLNKMSKSLGDFAEEAIGLGEDALPVVIDGLTWLLDNADLVVSGIAGIVAANMEMKVVAPAVEAVTSAWTAYKKANEGATVSQWLLNAAMNANPAGIIITAITALTAAMTTYLIVNQNAGAVMDETTQKTHELVEAAKALNEEMARAQESRQGDRDDMEAQAAACKKLVSELKELQKKTSLSTEEQIRQQMVVDELNQAIPELSLAINEQTGELNMSTEAIEGNVEALMERAKAAAAQEDMYEIAQQQYEAEKQLADLEAQMLEQKNAVAKAQDDYNAALEMANELYGNEAPIHHAEMLLEESTALKQAKDAQGELQEQIDATNESIQGFEEEYTETAAYISDTGVLDNAATAIGALGNAASDAGGRFAGMSAQAQAALEEMQTSLTDTITEQMDLFTKFNGKAELTKEQLLENMQSQVEGIRNWADNLAELAEKDIDQGLLKKLEEMGPAGAGYVATFVQMTEPQLQKANELFAESLSLPSEAAAKAVDSYITAGDMAAEGFKSGMTGKLEEVSSASGKMAEVTVSTLEDGLEENSPSRKTKVIGQHTGQGLAEGMKEEQPNITNVISGICGEIIRTSETFLCTSTFQEIGLQVPAGLEAGIRAGKSGVVAAVEEMCTEAVSKAVEMFEINSPSKKFGYLGEMSAEGYIGGLQRSMAHTQAVIAAAMPEASMMSDHSRRVSGSDTGIQAAQKNIDVNQTVNIYSPTDDLIATSRKFDEMMREAARQW